MDCLAEPVIGPRFARIRWLAMMVAYLPSHFGARFSENAFGPSM
jgi:hypothetical protein